MLSNDELKKIRRTFNDSTEVFATNSFKALSDSNRHRIFRLLSEQPKLSAGDIAETLNISRPLASQHLKILGQAGLLMKKRAGQQIFYELKKQNIHVRRLVSAIKKFV
jgi:DNA-binding transcriptional ArsR family regulator